MIFHIDKMRFKTRYRFRYIFLLFLSMLLVCTIVSFFANETGANTEAGEVVTTPGSTVGQSFTRNVFRFLYFVAFFYFTLNYYYHLVAGYKKILSFLQVTAAIIAVSFFYHALLFYLFPNGLQDSYGSLAEMFWSFLPGIIPMLLISFLIAYLTNMQEALKQRRVLQEQKLQLEMEITQANFNFLKAQINPHFLHNTLNFLYAKSLPYSRNCRKEFLPSAILCVMPSVRKIGKTVKRRLKMRSNTSIT